MIQSLNSYLAMTTGASVVLPLYFDFVLRRFKATKQQIQLMQSFSLLFLGATLSTLATLNFSLSLVVGLLASPLSFVRAPPKVSDWRLHAAICVMLVLLYNCVSPPAVLYWLQLYTGQEMNMMLLAMAKAWGAQGVWTSLVIWGVWWPAWVVGGVVLFSGSFEAASK